MLVKKVVLVFLQALAWISTATWALTYTDFDVDELCDYTCGQTGNSWYVAISKSTSNQYNANNQNNYYYQNYNRNGYNRNGYSDECKIKCLPKTQAAELILLGKATCGTQCAETEPVLCDIEYVDSETGGYQSSNENENGLVKACPLYYMPYMIHYTNSYGKCSQYCVTQQSAAKYMARGGSCGSC